MSCKFEGNIHGEQSTMVKKHEIWTEFRLLWESYDEWLDTCCKFYPGEHSPGWYPYLSSNARRNWRLNDTTESYGKKSRSLSYILRTNDYCHKIK